MSNTNAIPLSYTTPPFPSLYWPFDTSRGEANYLYTLSDIFRFTLYWTLITIPLAHLVVALIATVTQFSSAYQRSQYLRQFKTGHAKIRSSSLSPLSSDLRQEKKTRQASSGSGNSNGAPIQKHYTTTSTSTTDSTATTTEHKKPGPSASRKDNTHSVSENPTKSLVKSLSTKNKRLLGTSPYKEALQRSVFIVILYVVIGTVEATIAGSLVGVVLGAVYNAGYFRMSVWTPLAWGIVNMLVLILASFRISGGL